tara:strand:- start:1116 stop:2075 length:960 start_codon:yes stop_codon:yes gene_type:complete
MKNILTLIFAFVFLSSSAQQNNIVNSDDAEAFLSAYFSPFSNSIGAGLNSGWYNTAKPHKLAGFDVSLTINMITLSDEQKSFNPNDIANFSSSDNSTPTILGEGMGAEIDYTGSNFSSTFTMPEQNISLTSIPIPTLNAGIGLVKGTELNIRYIPAYDYDIGFIGEGSIELYGAGVKHDLLQWIPIVNKLPFDLSFQAALSRFKTSFEVESQSVKQDVSLNIDATTYNLILSKKFALITAYGSMGYNSVKTSFNSNTNFQLGSTNVIEFNVPLDMEFESQSVFQAAAGVRLQFAIFTVYANQTFSDYPITSAGIGISFR